MVAKFLDHNNEGAEGTTTSAAKRTAKRQKVYFSKTITLHVHHAFLYIFLAIAERLRSETSYIHGFVLLLNLDTVHSDSTQKISSSFDKLNEIE